MVNWVKTITFWVLVIIVGFVIHYLNDIYLHNLTLYLLTYAYVFGLLVLSGVLFNNDLTKENSVNDTKLVEHRIREKTNTKQWMDELNLKDYFKTQYIHNEIDNLQKVRHKKVY